MRFLLILTIIAGSLSLFSFHLINSPYLALQILGMVWPVAFLISLVSIIIFFRRRARMESAWIPIFMGTLVFTAAPPVLYLIFGGLYLVSGSLLFMWIGVVIALWLAAGIVFGIVYGRWNWKVVKVELEFDRLPEELNGITLVQISDVHVGSFGKNRTRVRGAIDKINSLHADYVLFTGDLVNNRAIEMNPWIDVFSGIQAKKGKFSILGNHDYGDYVSWSSKRAKEENLDDLIDIHRKIGFTPLLNEHVELNDSGTAYLVGVENWGTGFKQKGELRKAMDGVPQNAFKILMSHDPSHWDAQVLDKTDIELTLSGHTHGMQFGIERFGLRFSPVQFRYPRWAGLYQQGRQYLYVNRGFGFIGFPGRVGIYPEITHFTLKRRQ